MDAHELARRVRIAEATVMPWGKYKCRRLGELPLDYLDWYSREGGNAELKGKCALIVNSRAKPDAPKG